MDAGRYPHTVPAKPTSSAAVRDPRALGLGLLAYVIWGFFPLYFRALEPAGALEVIVHRAFWGLLSALVVILALSRKELLLSVIRDRRLAITLAVAGTLTLINWTTYVYAVLTDRTVDAALGYFINPLVTVALAAAVLRERLTRAQIVAIILGVLAVVVFVVGMGELPWISLVLAFSFGFYGLLKKKVAHKVPPLEGLAVETGALVPFLGVYYAYLAATQQTSFHSLAQSGPPGAGVWLPHLLLLVGAGILTMIPLLLFARAAKGLPLAVLGLIQYLTPVMQMVIAVLVFHEYMSPARWVATGIIWVALVVLSSDWVRQLARGRG